MKCALVDSKRQKSGVDSIIRPVPLDAIPRRINLFLQGRSARRDPERGITAQFRLVHHGTHQTKLLKLRFFHQVQASTHRTDCGCDDRAHDSVGAPIWMIGTRAAGSTSSLALAYYYSNYPGGLPVTACAHSGCVSAARPAGEFVAGARSGVEFNVQVNSAEVGPRLESRDSRR